MKLAHIIAIASLAIAFGANAQTAPASAADHAAHHPASAATPQSDAEVKKVDKAQGKLTLRHGPLDNLSMPAMTMVFKVADPKMLDEVKEGDKVKFTAEKVNGAFTVTAIQPAK
ncbi:MAG: RND transporter [Roseateles depolymerans]|uniref:RND transporter n=1 Tax=Roseateles depolymerans TaxID=76731 RepID=A0A2W5FFA5_9BURK|nr:MAG: RND transporter [Roseateles depolymerans]